MRAAHAVLSAYIREFEIFRKQQRKVCRFVCRRATRRGQNGLFQLVARKAAVARLPGTGKLHSIEIGQQRRIAPRVQHIAPAFCLKLQYLQQLCTRIIRKFHDVRKTALQPAVGA